jgi:hypothetical protein
MKKNFYCAQAEFYENGNCLLHVNERLCKEKPRNQFRQTPIGDFCMDWFETREQAEAFLAERTLKTA